MDPFAENLLVEALYRSTSRGETYLQALNRLADVSGYSSMELKDHYLGNHTRLDAAVSAVVAQQVPATVAKIPSFSTSQVEGGQQARLEVDAPYYIPSRSLWLPGAVTPSKNLDTPEDDAQDGPPFRAPPAPTLTGTRSPTLDFTAHFAQNELREHLPPIPAGDPPRLRTPLFLPDPNSRGPTPFSQRGYSQELDDFILRGSSESPLVQRTTSEDHHLGNHTRVDAAVSAVVTQQVPATAAKIPSFSTSQVEGGQLVPPKTVQPPLPVDADATLSRPGVAQEPLIVQALTDRLFNGSTHKEALNQLDGRAGYAVNMWKDYYLENKDRVDSARTNLFTPARLPPPNSEVRIPNPPTQSPTPPARVAGSQFSPTEKAYFIDFIMWRLEGEPIQSRNSVYMLMQTQTGRLATSWSAYWSRNHDLPDKIMAKMHKDV
ncbi:hypothetical protein C8R46DRAFT_1212500 [Mycena filopes]|nr:hypothetical protein C8R46DRAFT_1212500 [Mycena filopes]